MAAGAGPKDVDDVLGICVPMLLGNGLCPGFHFARFYLCSRSTFPANQVVMVARRTCAVKVFPFDAERISTSFFGKRIQSPIDGRQANRGTGTAQFLVQLLGAHELWCRL